MLQTEPCKTGNFAVLVPKKYISLVFAFIFIAKFFAVEAKGFNMVFSETKLSVIKAKCKNFTSLEHLNETSKYAPQESKNSDVVIFVSECSTPMLLNNFTWDFSPSHPALINSPFIISSLSYEDLKNSSPPPRCY